MKPTQLLAGLRCSVLPLVDVLLLHASFLLAYWFLHLMGQTLSLQPYLEMSLFISLVGLAAFVLAGLYRPWDEYAFSKGIDGILAGVLGALGALLFLVWMQRDRLRALRHFESRSVVPGTEAADVTQIVWGFPTRVLLIVAVLAPLLIWTWRLLANALERQFIGWSAYRRRILIVGEMNDDDIERLHFSSRPRYEIVGSLKENPGTEEKTPCLGSIDRLDEVLADEKLDEAFLLGADMDRQTLLRALEICYTRRVRPRVVMGIRETLISAMRTELRGPYPLYGFEPAGIRGWTLVVKRLMDVLLAATGVLITFPLLVFPACVLIVIDSKGWPVFSQERVGLRGRRFRLHKLRTMVIDADVRGGPLTTDADPRITRLGHFLRRTSIDELPQLWNVVKGDMSLVGPRAVIPYVADQFQDWERVSLLVRPGVTGLAQVSGRDAIGFWEKSLLNVYYVRNHSVWLDLRILFDTVWTVLSMEGTRGTKTT